MLDILQTILVTLLTLAILVAVHEFGHFWVARRCGVKVLRFSVGFGKPLLSWTDRSGTEYVIAGIPLGGYVKMLDEREAPVPEELVGQAFNRASPKSRIAIAAAGPIANLILAVFVYWLVFLNGVSGVAPIVAKVEPGSLADQAGIVAGQEFLSVDGRSTPTWEALQLQLLERIGEDGDVHITLRSPDSDFVTENVVALRDWMHDIEEPNPVRELGVTLFVPEVVPKIETVVADSPAERAGMRAGDLVVEADGRPLESWQAWVEYVRQKPQEPIAVTVERDTQRVLLTMTPDRKLDGESQAYGYVGVGVAMPSWPESMQRTMEYGFVGAGVAAVDKTWRMSAFTLSAIKKMLMGLLSPKNLSGPITIAKVASSSAQYGFYAWLTFLALLSISLAVLNLLPIPVLDGGHIVYALVEWLTGKPVAEQVQVWANQLGLVLVVFVMIFALYNDVLRL
ncbi:sigma E protease regulator RseP [Zhongshania sp.]|uniref:sigma E protease regulator RseP n=1 Tax=Zhongshania sp. TaxID=1971902 RepID=UPI001B79EF17|nr:sigma E protease regulator RseP [Zhongshania sp.]MBQ0797597.1 sigma E protease regulator RseP [Zhongshania sp.]